MLRCPGAALCGWGRVRGFTVLICFCWVLGEITGLCRGVVVFQACDLG